MSPSPPRTVEQPQACSKSEPSRKVAGRGGKHSPPKCRRQRGLHCLTPSSSRMKLCSISRGFMIAGRCHGHHLQMPGRGGTHSSHQCQRQSRARTLSPPAPRIKQQQRIHFRCSKSQRQAFSNVSAAGTTWSLPPRTVEQSQASFVSRRSMAAPLQTALQVAGRGGKHSSMLRTSAGGRDEHAHRLH